LKKPTGSVRFRFYNQKTKKTNQNRKKPEKNRAKTEKTKPHQFEPVFALKNRTEPKLVGLTRFRFFFKKIGLITLFNKNHTEPKIITSIFFISHSFVSWYTSILLYFTFFCFMVSLRSINGRRS